MNCPNRLSRGSVLAAAFAAGTCLFIAEAQADTETGQSVNVVIIGGTTLDEDCSRYGELTDANQMRWTYGGCLPVTGPSGELGDFTFTPMDPPDVSAASLAPYDTAVLNVASYRMACDTRTLSDSQLEALVDFVKDGKKLIIFDSECFPGPVDYSWLPYPFTTSNPGALGDPGTLTVVEDNLLSTDILDPDCTLFGDTHCIDVARLGPVTDAVGDMNVLTTFDPNWCVDMSGTNALGVSGPVHTYATVVSGLNEGLIIYNGLDQDWQYEGLDDPDLRKIWVQELQHPFNPAGLPCGLRAVGIDLEPPSAANVEGEDHTVTATLTDLLGNPQGDVDVTFEILSGPNAGASGTCDPSTCWTDANGEVSFTYAGLGGSGTDEIQACFFNDAYEELCSPVVTKTWLCDPTVPIDPPFVEEVLPPGGSIIVEKCICVPPVAEAVDVVFAMDLTGSMSQEVGNLKTEINTIITNLRASAGSVDLKFGLVSYEDYPGYYDSCGYWNWYGASTDAAFRVDAPIGFTDLQVQAAVNAMSLGSGADGPQSYGRVFWETAQSGSGINFRPGALQILVNFGDNVPHDCDLSEGLPAGCDLSGTTGVDPGRDGLVDDPPYSSDDIDFQDDALAAMISAGVKLVAVYSGSSSSGEFCAWEHWAESTGGRAAQIGADGSIPGGLDLSDLILGLVSPELVLVADDECRLDITFDPPSVIVPLGGGLICVEETIGVPEFPFPCCDAYCVVTALVDGVPIGEQDIWIEIDFPPVEPDVRTQGFWKRICKKSHPSGEHENLPEYVDCVNNVDSFFDVMTVDDLCDRLHPDPENDKCEQAEAQFMALLLNIASCRISTANCIDDQYLGPTTVGYAVSFIDELLSDGDRTQGDCTLAQAIADAINSGSSPVDCP